MLIAPLMRLLLRPRSWPTIATITTITTLGLLACAACQRTTPRDDPPAAYPPLLPEGGAVFFVGNSFFGWQDRPLPQWVAAVGSAASPPVAFETGSDIQFGDAPLADFLHHDSTQQALASHRYDVFVLQGHELEPVDHRAEFHAAVREFDDAVRAAGGRTVLFLTWDFPWRSFIDELAASYDEIGRERGIPVIPAGLAYEDCRRSPPPGRVPYWLTANAEHPEGDLHPNALGSALNAYATFAVLTGRDPQGTMFDAPGRPTDPELLRLVSNHAWARAAPRLQPQEAR